jgi:hypothetical protein
MKSKSQELFSVCLIFFLTFGSGFVIIYQMEIFMESIDLAYIVILLGSVYAAWHLGKREGISITLDYCKQQGQIDFDE